MRICARLLLENNYIVNPVEYPAVPKGTARYRLQMMTAHTKEQIDGFINALILCEKKAKEIIAAMPKNDVRDEGRMQAVPKL